MWFWPRSKGCTDYIWLKTQQFVSPQRWHIVTVLCVCLCVCVCVCVCVGVPEASRDWHQELLFNRDQADRGEIHWDPGVYREGTNCYCHFIMTLWLNAVGWTFSAMLNHFYSSILDLDMWKMLLSTMDKRLKVLESHWCVTCVGRFVVKSNWWSLHQWFQTVLGDEQRACDPFHGLNI